MNHKSSKIASLIEPYRGQGLNAYYLGYFECFNGQLFFEAHEVLEALWLPERRGPNGNFYKGLIQLAGAFVHLQKGRAGPAAALFKLAEGNLRQYPSVHESLNVASVYNLIGEWLPRMDGGICIRRPLTAENAPKLSLIGGQDAGGIEPCQLPSPPTL